VTVEKTTARFIITKACQRSCPYCSNNYTNILKKAIPLEKIDILRPYKEVLLTGGEPMLYPDRVEMFATALRAQNPEVKLYLYSALYAPELDTLIKLLDGVHYSLHVPFTDADVEGFIEVQNMARVWTKKSFRLYIHPDIPRALLIYPNSWKRLEVKPWLSEEECKLPAHEDLYILGG
jgi:pyruvate-formate lyase-activating enzyme